MKNKTFLINMKKSTERLEFMSNQLKVLDISFEIQEGVDGKTYDFSNLYDEALSIKKNGTPLSSVEKGCAMSHRSVLEKALKEDLDYVLVLEDDIELPSDFKKIIETELNNRESKRTNWEYLAFNYPTVGWKFIKLWWYLIGEQFRKNPSLRLYAKIPIYTIKFLGVVIFSMFEGLRDRLYRNTAGKPAHFYRPMYLAGCYLVTREGIKKLLDIQNKIIYPADAIQNVARITKGLRLFHYVPLLAKQRRDKLASTMLDHGSYVYEHFD